MSILSELRLLDKHALSKKADVRLTSDSTNAVRLPNPEEVPLCTELMLINLNQRTCS